ncbi:putative Guanine nucleotide-binding protein, partial [Naja naja]
MKKMVGVTGNAVFSCVECKGNSLVEGSSDLCGSDHQNGNVLADGLPVSISPTAGFPNVGKSSLINSLKRSRACNTGATPGIT